MERLISRVRKLSNLHAFSDALLISLLSKSELQPDIVQQGVVLFEKDEPTLYWYLLLSGEVQLYDKTYSGDFKHIETLHSGSLFGDLSTITHSCSSIVARSAQLIRISQDHFLSLYNRHGDHLQPFIVIMHDIFSDDDPSFVKFQRPCSVLNDLNINNRWPSKVFQVSTKGSPSIVPFISPFQQTEALVDAGVASPEPNSFEHNLIEFHKPCSAKTSIFEAGSLLQQRMFFENSQIIRDIITPHASIKNCMVGAEMIDWLLNLFISTSSTSSSLSRIQMNAIWQVLLNQNVISHIGGEHVFHDKTNSFYRWSRYCKNRKKEPPTMAEILKSVSFLSSIAPDTLFLMIVSKPGCERSPEELEFVYDEIMYIKALSHLSTMVKRQLASFFKVEHYAHSGSIVFREGDIGIHWYIVLRGAVEVSVKGKIICVLREGDDFGKLALVNDLPRASTIVTYENDSEFLLVDKNNFNQVLLQVESNTVRLREFEEDVLVLEKVDLPLGAALENYTTRCFSNFGYSVMAGKAEKILEYVLETRIDALSEDITELDLFVEDFLLTHDAFMPTNSICTFLKSYYCKLRPICGESVQQSHFEYVRTKRRVVMFVYVWCSLLRSIFFLNPVTNSFVEELFCLVLEDSKKLGGMENVLSTITNIRSERERMQLVLARHPAVVLDCGVLSAHTPCSVLPTDVCNQIIYLADTTCFVLSIRVDKTSEEICELSRRRMSFSSKPLYLVEVKSNGEKLIFSHNDRAIPTVLSLNSKLYVVSREEITLLAPMEDQKGPSPMSHSSILHLIDSQELAHQLFLFHLQLLKATDSNELLYQIIGREAFPTTMPFNLDLLVRRFNEVQHWATTEVLLALEENRANILKKFIEISTHARDNQDLLTVFAITLGLSHTSVSRLSSTWNKLPTLTRSFFSELESLLDPTRNHRMYRNMISKMSPPFIPFVPLILKDLMFIHQGNKSFYNGLVNFEKMHMFANVLRNFRHCKGYSIETSENELAEPQGLIRNLRVIDNQQTLMQLSLEIEPKVGRRYIT